MVGDKFMYLLLTYYWFNKIFLSVFNEENYARHENFLVCVLKRNDRVIKTLWIFLDENNVRCETLFSFKEKSPCRETLCCIFYFEEGKTGHKNISYCKAYCVGYYFFRCCSHCTYCADIWILRFIVFLKWHFAFWYMYIYIFIENKTTSMCKNDCPKYLWMEMNFSWKLFPFIYLHFNLKVTWYRHLLYLFYRRNQHQ